MPETSAGTVFLNVQVDNQQFNKQMSGLADEAQRIMNKAISGGTLSFDTSGITSSLDEMIRSIDTLGDNLMSQFSKSMEQGAVEGMKSTAKVINTATFPKVKIEFSEAQLREQINLLGQKWQALDDQRLAQAQKVARLQEQARYGLPGDPSAAKANEDLALAQRKLVDLKMAAAQADAQVYALEQRLEQMGQVGAETTEPTVEAMSQVSVQAQATGANVSRSFAGMVDKSRSSFSRFGRHAAGFMGTLKKIISHLNIFKRSSASSFGGLNKVMRFGLMALGIRSIYMMIRRMVNIAKEGFGEIGNQFDGFQKKLTQLKDGMGMLKASFAGMLAPVFEAVLPIINTLIARLVDAFNAIGMFFARLFGQDTYKRLAGYNSAVEDGAGAADDSNAAHKRLFRTLASFDELEILKSPSVGVGGGGGGGATGGTPIYEEVPVEPLFGEGNKLSDLINKWIGELDGASVGKQLSDFLVTAFEAAFTFIEEINWSGLGTSIGDAWNNLDWYGVVYGLGRTIFSSLKGLADLLGGWLLTTNWKSIGSNIGKAISDLDWAGTTKSIADAIWGALSGIVNLLSGFLQNADWVKISSTIYDALAGLDWGGLLIDLAGLIGAGFGAALGVVWGLLKSAWNDVKAYWAEEFHENGRLTFASFFKGINTTFGKVAGFMTELVTNFGSALLHALGLHAEANLFTEMGNKAADAFKKSFIDGLLTLRQNSPFYQVSFGPDSTAGQYQQHLEDLMDQEREKRGSGGASGSWSTPSPPSTSLPPLKGVSAMATGGYVTQPTLTWVGEQSRKEAVLPLERNTGWADILLDRLAERGGLSGGGDIHITQPVYLGTDQLISVIEMVVDREGRLRNRPVFG